MIKNLNINYFESIKIKSSLFHSLIGILSGELNFSISSLIINFVSQDQILDLNKKYLQHNYTTDIITFNYSGDNILLDGEIFISVEDAIENAKQFDVNVNDEFIRLVIHGILHLLGYDDSTEKEKEIMKNLENDLVEKYKYDFLTEEEVK